ncbi:ABC transporter ATP-binding protein [Nodosilinea sp. PGN35]|uniref:ABC transporter ATP-binding protein n=1 Tax=Nodosilinea sp. PGN35 TaxID=3020489 RepID=UPI0023B22902|nr:ABC transporter ATP-binding protein [Nodosilinea sp. TSF1-S3]MDF0367607.1 ABC transporter ATP-binding protein [Nodosilinea sp. TSF1-S3]
MQEELSIVAENVSKKFGLTLKQSMKYGLRDIGKNLLGRQVKTELLRQGEFWAVRDVSFTLRRGEALGIMGVNGSGKTTLLRILNGVYAPDTGFIQMRGRVGALIAAGAGFAPMLSGRENVYVNGALLGLSTEEIDSLIDEIVAFSELSEFIDLPVKNYSSGMYVRLGFAIAALSRPDILLMDEVLAVGDLNFQKKCFDYILKLKQQGTAIILVSHSPGAIWSVCDRGLFMDHGLVEVNGTAEDVVRAYDDQNSRNALASNIQFNQAVAANLKKDSSAALETLSSEYGGNLVGTNDVVCHALRVVSAETGLVVNEVEFQEPIVLELDVEVYQEIRDFVLRIVIDAVHYKNILTLDSYEQGYPLGMVAPGKYKFTVKVSNQNLRPGAYNFNIAVISKHVAAHLFLWLKCGDIIVLTPKNLFFYSEPLAVMHVPADFSYQKL